MSYVDTRLLVLDEVKGGGDEYFRWFDDHWNKTIYAGVNRLVKEQIRGVGWILQT